MSVSHDAPIVNKDTLPIAPNTASFDATAVPQTWGFAENAAGMMSQVKGLAAAIGLPAKVQEITLAFPWNRCWPGLVPLGQFVFPQPEVLFAGEAPRVVISCARQAIMASLWLKKKYGDRVYTVHIQDPKIDPRKFDLVVAPEHDGLTGPNVFQSRGALHHISPQVVQAAQNLGPVGPLKQFRSPFVTVLLGGPNKCYSFSSSDLQPMVTLLKSMAKKYGVPLAILPSRRTPDDVLKMFQDEFGSDHYVWDKKQDNPYISALCCCSHLIVTGDSVSMLSECAATEKPVFVFELPERRKSERFRQFHRSFMQCGISRPFTGDLDVWQYESPNPTQRIAELIRQRIGENDVVSARSAA
ncbi:mitochondrial fission ELM1 family protein [Planctomicrobium sp. SH668]|uniref:mitochondrial fission ELM1 family protein n=1 Tax=Planctomicrobium sp. SH668 TaxID=3448126 RepID=UPI003F5C105A